MNKCYNNIAKQVFNNSNQYLFGFTLILLFCFTTCFAQNYEIGNTYFDSTGFVEYRAGNLPIILSAPHGGNWSPDSIPDRNCSGCSYNMDSYTRIITWGIYDEIHEITGCYPHLVMNRLHRIKFDANRDIDDAADGNPLIEQAWFNYHDFIDLAKNQIELEYERGLFLDIHGHGHTIQRIELGYTLSIQELGEPDNIINSTDLIEESSIRTLISDNILGFSHSDLLRGPLSFGTMMDERGFPSVPSTSDPFPTCSSGCYFSGGYNTQRHGSRDNNGHIDAIQVELDQTARNSTNRPILIDSLSATAINFIETFYGYTLQGGCCRTNITHNGVISDGTYNASNEINSTGQINGIITYQAGHSITLDPLFCKPSNNKAFEIIIDDCND